MAFREVPVFEVREVLRLWLRGEGFRSIERLAVVDRKTVRRYVTAGVEAGLVREDGEGQLNDVVIGAVCERVRPHRPAGHGPAWAALVANHDQLKTWLVEQELTAVKAGELLARQGVVVPERTLHRYALEVLGVGRSARGVTVRVADGEPGAELQIDFGKMGMIVDPDTGRRRVVWALIFTACYSRHTFVWLTHRQTTEEVIAGCEAAWAFFLGVFAVVVPDNMKAIVDRSDPLAPRFNQAFIEYAQARGFVVDPARVRTPTDKPRVERTVPFVRNSFFAGETFVDLGDAQRRAEEWCLVRAGMRIHGTIQCRPAELFALEEASRLKPAPDSLYDLPVYARPKVHRDHHIEVAKALYSVPGNLIGQRVEARADSRLVRVFSRGQLIKTHPRTRAGGRVTDPADLPAERTAYAMRDLEHLKRLAGDAGPAVGAYTAAVLDHPLPWTKMRQAYALLGLVKRWGPDRVEAACRRALDAEAIDVGLIGRMLDRATETATAEQPATPPAAPSKPARFARDPKHFASNRKPRNVPPTESDTTEGGVA
ncbi:MAG: Putative transposase [uncultured Acidimicrobiales bacterium]|uniref:Transposase n=1 Tax=uncultured Acidimicrobiales bacterium TaxID=310071 RepID=A0A6J4HQF9_9ACTN|nr:MAG: Putative transposase [uncultured Acidimicrobiales bacterium]